MIGAAGRARPCARFGPGRSALGRSFLARFVHGRRQSGSRVPLLRRALLVAALVVFVPGAGLAGRASYLALKRAVAVRLIEGAWSATIADGRPRRPWPWADFTTVGRLEAPRLGVSRPILSDATGRTLTWGLALVPGTATPDLPGHTVVSGHRDGWAGFLRDLRTGDAIDLVAPSGERRRYRVVGSEVVDARDAAVLAPTAEPRLTLLTCWPFDGLLPARERYLVTAEAANGPDGSRDRRSADRRRRSRRSGCGGTRSDRASRRR